MSESRIPPPPAEFSRGIDYRQELLLARLSRASYLDEAAVTRDRTHPDHALFDQQAQASWTVGLHENHNATTGFVAYAFVNEAEQRVVIAVRGSDNAADWRGPNAALARDGELLELANLPAPATARTRAQMAAVQEALLPGEAWDPQFKQALEFARTVRDHYGAQGYRIETAGHSLGGAHAQLISHTFGWPGRSFDAPGAANIVESDGYRQWLAEHGHEPMRTPAFRNQVGLDSGFLNYAVNNSAVSRKTGPHLGDVQSISSLEGREGFASHGRYALGIASGGLQNTPLLGQVLKASGAGRLATTMEHGAHVGHHGVDAADRHAMDRIVKVFEEAVRRQDRGDRQPLPIFGEQRERADLPLARTEAALGMPGAEDALRRQRQATRALLDGAGGDALGRFLDTVKRDDSVACRDAARALAETPEAQAWLQAGYDRLQAIERARDALAPEQAPQQHARAPEEQGLVR
ncbi:hypothetical protein [Luteimonas huabeiensis]|uniref:hypothetical protein n=1 Tax=Luteimonas huabeiensis TaxID=1244513 RepID=UPI0004B2DE13|nr:hypothetical protein [Luteimonas huabeiensis]